MKVIVKCGNILNEPADVLVCSANCMLNLSGGVGGELLSRYGMTLQRQLHEMLEGRKPRSARAGEVFLMVAPALPYKAVLHAVAVDPWYHSNEVLVHDVVMQALRISAQLEARKVAMAALATGYGDMDFAGFGKVIAGIRENESASVEELVICLEESERVDELSEAIGISS